MASALTRQERIAEIVKCGQDPVYLINEYMSVQHPFKGTLPFETYPFQNDVITSMLEHRFNIVLKSRQLGLSTITAAYAAWLAIFHKDKNILIIATKKDVAINLIKKIKFMIKSLPEWLVLPTFEETMTSMRFSNGSEIKAVPTSPDAGRSEALSLLIVDEAAIIRDFEDIWTGLSPTLSTGGSAIILSTPYGVGGTYYKLWTEAEAGQNGFNPIRLPWYVHPEHDQEWFENETKNLPKRKIAQEYLCDFISSGDTFLQIDVLQIIGDARRQPMEKLGDDRNVWIWRRPIPEHRYVISADVARGDATDYSAFHILDAETCEVVGEYMGKVPPEKLADMMIEYGKLYNTALLCPENNSFGYSTCSTLKRANYPKLYYQNHRGDPFLYMPQNEELPGFSTQSKSRLQILTKLEELLRNKQLHVFSHRLYDQLQAFIWQGAKPMALKDAYDDLIMSLAIGAWIVGGASDATNYDSSMSLAMLQATSRSSRNTSTLPLVNEVQPLVNPNIRGINAQNVHKPRDASEVRHADLTDFSWLL
jgi:hypothetical protein